MSFFAAGFVAGFVAGVDGLLEEVSTIAQVKLSTGTVFTEGFLKMLSQTSQNPILFVNVLCTFFISLTSLLDDLYPFFPRHSYKKY